MYNNYVSVETRNNFLKKVFLQMFLGVLLTAVISYFIASNRSYLYSVSRNFYLISIVQIVLVLVLNFSINKISTSAAMIMFFAYSALNGLLFSAIAVIFRLDSIIYALVATLAIFIAMTLYGLFTKEDLSKYSSFFMGALIALVLVSVFNIFYASSTIEWVVSIFAIVIFTGLIAFDVNRIIAAFEQNSFSEENVNKLAVIGALSLYLDFINLFINILSIFGKKK